MEFRREKRIVTFPRAPRREFRGYDGGIWLEFKPLNAHHNIKRGKAYHSGNQIHQREEFWSLAETPEEGHSGSACGCVS